MKIERIQISAGFLDQVGFGNFFRKVEHVNLLNNFSWDANHFFSLAEITFTKEGIKNWRKILEEDLGVESVQELQRTGRTILAVMKSISLSGFWPDIEKGPWAILPPVSLDPESIILTLIAEDSFLPKIYEMLNRMNINFRILAVNEFAQENPLQHSAFPKFTARQQEIAKFAFRHGFFDSPKKISAEEIAAHFKISVSAINDHLRKAQRLALEYFFS